MKKSVVIVLAMLLVLTTTCTAFAKNTVGIALGFNAGQFMVLGEWRTTTTTASELSVQAGLGVSNGSVVSIPAEIGWKFDFLRITLNNVTLGHLVFGGKAKADAYVAFGASGNASLSASAGLYVNWFINSRWTVGTQFVILALGVLPTLEFLVPLSNITNATYNLSSVAALKFEFGYNKFILKGNNFHADIALELSF